MPEDPLTTGSKRLAANLKDEGLPVDMPDCWGEFIAADPGVKAQHAFVLHFAELDCCCNQMERLLSDLAGPDSPPFKCYSCLARIVLEKWEYGDA